MVRAVQAVTSEIGRSPGDFTMIAFGGSGPVHAASLALHAGIGQIVVPPASGVFSAFGLLFARIEHRLVRTCSMDSAEADLDRLASLARALQEEATALMHAEGVARDGCELICQLDLRYRGQSSELAVTVPIPLTRAALDQAVDAFHAEHERTYGYGNPGEATQIVNLRLRARALGHAAIDVNADSIKPAGGGTPADDGSVAAKRSDEAPGDGTGDPPSRQVFFGSRWGWRKTPVLRRHQLAREQAAAQAGPLVIEEYDTTIVVPPGATAWRDGTGSVRIDLSLILQA